MRRLPILAGLMLIAGAAAAQPAPDQGQMPGPQMGPGGEQTDQGAPPPPPPQGYNQGGGYGQQPAQGYNQGGGYGQGGGNPQQPPRGGHRPFRDKFEAANVTHDGKLTLEQARAAHVGIVVHHFDEMDTEHKGYVTLQDVRTWHMAMRQARGQGGPQQGGPQQGGGSVTPPPPGMAPQE